MAYALGAWAGWIAWYDWRRQRIPNAGLILVLVPALLSLAINRQGLLQTPIFESLIGLMAAAGLLFPGYLMGYMGAGDVKFAGLLGLLVGGVPALKMMLIFGLLLGVMSLSALWWYRGQPQTLKRRIAAAPALAAGFAVLSLTDGITVLLQGVGA